MMKQEHKKNKTNNTITRKDCQIKWAKMKKRERNYWKKEIKLIKNIKRIYKMPF